MKCFPKIVSDKIQSTIFAKSFILDVSLGSEYVSSYRLWIRLCFLYFLFHFESIKFRCSRSQMSFKIEIFKIFAKFKGKLLCWNPFFAGLRPPTLLKERPWHKRFPVNFSKFSEQLFNRTPPLAASVLPSRNATSRGRPLIVPFW